MKSRPVIVISKKRGVDVDQLMSHLFSTTSLERTLRVNMNVIGLDGRPRMFNTRRAFSRSGSGSVRKRSRNVSNIVCRSSRTACIFSTACWSRISISTRSSAIIREEDEPKPVLMKRFKLTDIQAEAILNLRLRNLAKLEEMKIRGEQDELERRARPA